MSLTKIRGAIETALNNMPGIIPAVNIVSSVNGLFTTDIAHNLVTNLNVTIVGHSVSALNGNFLCTVTGANSFKLAQLISGVAIVIGVSGSGGTVTANLTAWEGIDFSMKSRIPYQKVNLLPLNPDNATMGSNYYREEGIYQITLIYPIQSGPGLVTARAELIRETFPRGSSFSNNGVTVNISKTPAILAPYIYEENISVVVRIQYWANIFRNLN